LLRFVFSYGLLVGLALCVVSQLVRDRALPLALLMFVPILPCALVALLWDVWLRGRALQRRWLLSGFALVCAVFAVSLMWEPARAVEPTRPGAALRLVQWNTMWGGHNRAAFEQVVEAIDAQQPDVVCMSEAPDESTVQGAWAARHAGWHTASVNSADAPGYWYNFIILSRYPARVHARHKLSHGYAVLFEVSAPSGMVRLLVADLLSSPVSPRTPSLREVAALAEREARAGRPVDIILGDFNTPARFLGFDDIAAASGGFERAALWSGAWRGTWPSFVPLSPFDIDHVWVSKRWRVLHAAFFSRLVVDHRGQTVVLQPP
jgi:endonuclease/exonuclease/phosphatase (EEP) superfamily protein YafD